MLLLQETLVPETLLKLTSYGIHMKVDDGMEEIPIITPSQFLLLGRITTEDNQFIVAIVAFCSFHKMNEKARVKSLDKSLFVHKDVNHQFQG